MKKVLKLLVAFAIVLLTVSMSSGETASAWEVRIGEQNFGYRGTFDGIGSDWNTPEKRACYPEFTVDFFERYLYPLIDYTSDSEPTAPHCIVSFRLNMTGAESEGKVIAVLPQSCDYDRDIKYADWMIFDALTALRIYDKKGKTLILEVVKDKTSGYYALLSHGTDFEAFVKKGYVYVSGNSTSGTSEIYISGSTTNYTMINIKGCFPGLTLETEGYDRIKPTYKRDGVSHYSAGSFFSPTGKTVLDAFDIYDIHDGNGRSETCYANGKKLCDGLYTKELCRSVVITTSIGVAKQPDKVASVGTISVGHLGITHGYGEKTVKIYDGHSFNVPSVRLWYWTNAKQLVGRTSILTNPTDIKYLFNNLFIFVREGNNNTIKIYVGHKDGDRIILKGGEAGNLSTKDFNTLMFKYEGILSDYKTASQRADKLYELFKNRLIAEGYIGAGRTYTFEFYDSATTVSQGYFIGKTTKTVTR